MKHSEYEHHLFWLHNSLQILVNVKPRQIFLLFSLKAAGEVISDKAFGTVVMQRETQIMFSDFKVALRNQEENERCCSKDKGGNTDGVMAATNGAHKPNKFMGKCFKCGRKGHNSVDCFSNKVIDKWCQRCRNNSHNTKDCRKGNYDSARVALQRKEQRLNNNSSNHSFIFTIKDEESRGEITPNLLLDTGATSHIMNDKSKFVDFDSKFDPSTHFNELADGSRQMWF